MLRFINELLYITVITIFLGVHTELHYALVFFLFGSMIAALKYDIQDEEHSYLYKTYRQHIRNRKEI
ncbi:hypothetical protein [Staphylococcus hominis]|uniref:hypothetical protein n=1 Tax=Staphylococcus hominis TaxID=1290 RepID=UPI00066D4D22|nr:hypothetical protein [Staphylococcus hominis]